jgi:hypothetical protein
MSDIPRARAILRSALKLEFNTDPHFLRKAITAALKLMTRKSPAFRVEHDAEPMTNHKCKRARNLRRKGLSLRAIALALNTNIGRVSEAINGKHG